MIVIPQNIDSKYQFITLAAQRCNQLMRGARPRLETSAHKPTTIAQEEVLAGLVGLGVDREDAMAVMAVAEPGVPTLVESDAPSE